MVGKPVRATMPSVAEVSVVLAYSAIGASSGERLMLPSGAASAADRLHRYGQDP